MQVEKWEIVNDICWNPLYFYRISQVTKFVLLEKCQLNATFHFKAEN